MTKEIGECFICKKLITDNDTDQVEMITGPEKTKVFVHNYHQGVKEELQKEEKSGSE